ncbi:ribonuclease G [Desulfosarcina ovata subsp. sediminis]|uniref:Ribonuclease G n=1 Tax=Desulfosarcina ovata subsp. sediminis TaxID=885957 RepID=A0A5K7ZUT3_9BACT|nr:Rne/Rng family ribonuclease [Desulfosarcina ovata]BBO84003.1 ribonuclease G [Desulfosarcina ovata subsp. sediminis]
MYKKIIINVEDHETRVALVEEETIVELFIERKGSRDNTGNIYKGRVQRVLPGMQAAFVDIGLNQAAFIYVDDVVRNNYSDIEEYFTCNDYKENSEETVELKEKILPIKEEKENIEDIISEGQEILVQVSKSPIGTKGARITSNISLPGRFLVLMPTSSHIGISRRIEDETERQRLKDIVTELSSNTKMGYIVRTAAEGVNKEKIAYEMGFLKNLWCNIQKKYQTYGTPSTLHQELNLSLRAVRDLLIQEAEKLVIDSKADYESVLGFLETFNPSLKPSVELYDGKEPIFDAYNLEGDISRALKKKVWLKSGGYIVIEHTEALVAIDVNTGRYVGKHNLEETILKTNLEAVKEIAYQIRLRDIGGIIIIDFIDMEKKSNQEKVFSALNEAFTKDRSKTHILPISEMGLIQMTRKRTRKPLSRLMCDPCPYCEGEGYIISIKSICYAIYREILRYAVDMTGKKLTLRVNPEVAEFLHGEENRLIPGLEKAIEKQIIIYPDSRYHVEAFEITESSSV